MTTIIGIKLTNRVELSNDFQNIISKYGCAIKTRIGLHSTCSSVCANWGIVLLEIIDANVKNPLMQEVSKLEDVKVQSMSL